MGKQTKVWKLLEEMYWSRVELMAAVTTLPKARFLSLVLNENKEDKVWGLRKKIV